MPQTCLLFIGTYSRPVPHAPQTQSEGIYCYKLDLDTGALTYRGVTPHADNPSYLTIDARKNRLYAVSEMGEWDAGRLSAYAIDSATGALTFINQQSTHGPITAYVSLDKTGSYAFAANYGSGRQAAAMFPIRADGGLEPAVATVTHEGSGPNTARQEGPHPHCAVLDPTNNFLYIPDLGIDRIMIYRFDPANRTLTPNAVPSLTLTPGSGPRHLVFHPNARYAYVIKEMGSAVTALRFNPATGALERVQMISMLPEDFKGNSSGSDVHVSPDGRFLYGGNRGHDSIAIFAIDFGTGRLTFVDHQPTGGRTPRNFAIDPTGTFLLAANQDTNTVVTFRIDSETGRLEETGHVTEVPTPVCLKMMITS